MRAFQGGVSADGAVLVIALVAGGSAGISGGWLSRPSKLMMPPVSCRTSSMPPDDLMRPTRAVRRATLTSVPEITNDGMETLVSPLSGDLSTRPERATRAVDTMRARALIEE